MTFEERIRIFRSLDNLINRKYRGKSKDYATKLGISRSAFFRILEYLRDEFGVPVIYKKADNRYTYQKKGSMYFGFLEKEED